MLSRFDICLVALDPTLGSEIKKTRPCVLISPNEINHSRLKTVIIAPMTSTVWEGHPIRVDVTFKGKSGQIALDQIRSVDRSRIVKKMGVLSKKQQAAVVKTLITMFDF